MPVYCTPASGRCENGRTDENADEKVYAIHGSRRGAEFDIVPSVIADVVLLLGGLCDR